MHSAGFCLKPESVQYGWPVGGVLEAPSDPTAGSQLPHILGGGGPGGFEGDGSSHAGSEFSGRVEGALAGRRSLGIRSELGKTAATRGRTDAPPATPAAAERQAFRRGSQVAHNCPSGRGRCTSCPQAKAVGMAVGGDGASMAQS